MIKCSDLIALKTGQSDFERFARGKGAEYVRRLSSYFWRRSSWCRSPIDQEDLFSIGLAALWEAVRAYRFRCPLCPFTSAEIASYKLHQLAVHGAPWTHPQPRMFRWVHAQVGRSMDHEMRRYTRRARWNADEIPEGYEPSEPPRQDDVLELRLLVEKARAELGPAHEAVLYGLAFELPMKAHGVKTEAVGLIRREVDEWVRRTRAG